MILQALAEHYRTLADQGIAPAFGWSNVRVSYVLCLGKDGALEQVISA